MADGGAHLGVFGGGAPARRNEETVFVLIFCTFATVPMASIDFEF